MSTARLRELRLVGFKSFAERTVVAFGPGISAVVGPNGSGKSNLADALRWALGEQGRALRTRRAEDLIFAGSASRRAVGMADVSLVIDNGDRLLPVDFGEVELSRRLYRSGENEYLLNRQRIRLRDLVDLLDDANLADNAFLFIGQGMVDQALAMRPEERRPLFEEAAGIRKHERRRRAAEADLVEAEANLERVRDLLAELRPQQRRLSAQAEQLEQRRSAGLELATALVAAARGRIGSLERESRAQGAALATARRDADAALSALREAEDAAGGLARTLTARADEDARRRTALDAARARVVELRMAEARASGDAAALLAQRSRIAAERTALADRVAEARATLDAAPAGAEDAADAAAAALAAAERRLAEAASDADALRLAGRADAERARAMRATRERLAAEAERGARFAAEQARRRAEQEGATKTAREAADRAEAILAAARAEAARAIADHDEAEAASASARGRLATGEATAAAARSEVAGLAAAAGGLEARLGAIDARLSGAVDERALRSARARGGRRLSEGLEVEPGLRAAVEAALGEVISGLVLDADEALALRGAAAIVVLREATAPTVADRAVARLDQAVRERGGGVLAEAVRRDPDGVCARLLARCRWVPDLETTLALRHLLPPGWRLATPLGEVVDDQGVVRPAPRTFLLGLRAEREEAAREAERVREQRDAAEAAAATAESALVEAEATLRAARGSLESARRSRHIAEERERAATRTADGAARERAWAEAVLERATATAAAAAADSTARAAELLAYEAGLSASDEGGAASSDAASGGAGIGVVEAADERVAALRRERDRVAQEAGVATAARETARDTRRRAELALALAAARGQELDRDEATAAEMEAGLDAARERLAHELALESAGTEREADAYEASVGAAREERTRLLAAESAASAARERLRAAEVRSRHGEVAELEARMGLEAARESLLVELAAIGPDGLAALEEASADSRDVARAAGSEPPGGDTAEAATAELGDDLATELERALATLLEAWRGDADGQPQPPAPGRVAALRRRFHELGAGNPFAADELAALTARLGSLEAQRDDLEAAIRDTRELMARLDSLIAEQFRQTFRALEGAFARSFRQLFGGGEAQLALTAPDDLGATGVDITARPPGKKRQPLAMLSGGERALTAVALLLAMLEVRPVPFCVLDEVDAALDEANIGRFATALRGLAETIQFVVITHNRGTIEAADALYGVTVGDDAVSRVVSLRLSDLPASEGGTASQEPPDALGGRSPDGLAAMSVGASAARAGTPAALPVGDADRQPASPS